MVYDELNLQYIKVEKNAAILSQELKARIPWIQQVGLGAKYWGSQKPQGQNFVITERGASVDIEGKWAAPLYTKFCPTLGHKYLFCLWYKFDGTPSNTTVDWCLSFSIGTNREYLGVLGYSPNDFTFKYKFHTPSQIYAKETIAFSIGVDNRTGHLEVKNLMAFDLTAMFGAGNEPETIETFQQYFPLPWYPTNSSVELTNWD